MAKKQDKQITLRFTPDEVEAWKLDAVRSGLDLANFLKARIRDGAHYADLTRQIQALTEERRRDREMFRVLLAVQFEVLFNARAVAHPATQSVDVKAANEAAIAAKRNAAREAASKTFADIYREQA